MTNVWWPNPGMPPVADNNPDEPSVKQGPDAEVDWPTSPDRPGHWANYLYGNPD